MLSPRKGMSPPRTDWSAATTSLWWFAHPTQTLETIGLGLGYSVHSAGIGNPSNGGYWSMLSP